jgi:uncharacterized RDD family membrane protein YckC
MDGTSTFRSCHQILGIGRDASGDEIALAYLRTAMRHHPASCVDEADRARARPLFREAAEAWAVLSDGRVASCRGAEGDARALAVFDETLAWHARELADRGLRAESVLNALMLEGCPQTVAWSAAEAATRDAALGTTVAPPSLELPEPVDDEDVPVLAAAKAAAAAINDADRRAADAFASVAAGTAATASAPPGDARAPLSSRPVAARFAAGARVAADTATVVTPRTPGIRTAARSGPASRRRGAPEGVAPRAGLRGPAARGVARLGDDEPDDLDPFPDLDARLEERVAATVADLAMIAVSCVAPVVLLGRLLEWSPLAVERLAIGAMLAGAAAWFVAGERSYGATPGKRLLGLTVERLDGGAPDARTAWLRHGLRTMSMLLGGLGYATAAITERRQALHDLLTETRVRSRGLQRPDLVWGLCAAPPLLAAGALAFAWLGG